MAIINQITTLTMILTGAALIRERGHGTIEHMLVMPLSAFEITLAKVWANVLVAVTGTLLFRSNHQWQGTCTMSRGTWGRIVGLCVVVAGTGLVYRAFIDRWEGDVKAPVIAAGMAGITYFVLILIIGSWIERREKLNRREPRN